MKMRLWRQAVACASVLALTAGVAAAQGPNPWADCDPIEAPVEIRPITSWTEGGAVLESFRFASHTWDGRWGKIGDSHEWHCRERHGAQAVVV